MMLSKSGLAIALSRLKGFESPKLLKEQYATDSEAVAEAVWFANMQGDIQSKVVADLGCGTGLLGIAALFLGAEDAYFIDSDSEALEICRENIASATMAKAHLLGCDVADFCKKIDTVIQNPPFGTKARHADRKFLMQAFKLAGVIYSFHKIETAGFVKKLAADNGFAVTHVLPLRLQLKKTYGFHRSGMKRVEVGWFRIARLCD